jgi:nitrogen fixation NifU-like protein
MTDLRRLYQKVILDHGKHPRNRKIIERADHAAEGNNPLCGDKLTVYIKSAGGRIEEISFEGGGCLISIASASMMTEAVKGRTAAECATLADAVDRIGDGGDALPEKLRALAGVSQFPVRIKCATLPWRTLRAALDDEAGMVTTE